MGRVGRRPLLPQPRRRTSRGVALDRARSSWTAWRSVVVERRVLANPPCGRDLARTGLPHAGDRADDTTGTRPRSSSRSPSRSTCAPSTPSPRRSSATSRGSRTRTRAGRRRSSRRRCTASCSPRSAGFGVALVNDSIYGYDVTRDVAATRSSRRPCGSRCCGRRASPTPRPTRACRRTGYGLRDRRGRRDRDARGRAHERRAARRDAALASVAPLVTVTGEGIVVSSVKLADDRSGDLVVRVYESLGGRARGTLRLDLPVGRVTTATLLEEPLDDGGCQGRRRRGVGRARRLRGADPAGRPGLRSAPGCSPSSGDGGEHAVDARQRHRVVGDLEEPGCEALPL